MSPRPCVAMKFTASGVTNCAAIVRSPSFSRSSSSTRMTILPARMSAMAPFTRSRSLGSMLITGGDMGTLHVSGFLERIEEGNIAILFFFRSAAVRQETSDITREEIHLEVHLRARPERVERRLHLRVRDQHDIESGAMHVVHREADASDADRAFRRDVLR